MKGILWDTAVKGARGERRYLLTAESSATPPCVNNKHFKAAWGGRNARLQLKNQGMRLNMRH